MLKVSSEMRKLKPKENPFEKNTEVLMVLTSHPRFLKRIRDLRVKIGIPESGFTSNLESDKWYERIFSNENKLAVFNLITSRLAAEFGLATNFNLSIETFLVFNKILAPNSVYISMNFDKYRKQEELKVQIFGEAREADWRVAWGTIKKLQKYLPGYNSGRFRSKTNLMAEKVAYDMSVQGRSYQDIYNALKDKHLGSHGNIERLINNFKKRLQKYNS